MPVRGNSSVISPTQITVATVPSPIIIEYGRSSTENCSANSDSAMNDAMTSNVCLINGIFTAATSGAAIATAPNSAGKMRMMLASYVPTEWSQTHVRTVQSGGD